MRDVDARALNENEGRRGRLAFFETLALSLALLIATANADASGELPSGSCVNDVGRGAMLWGSSSEVTTYSPPYVAAMTPEIYRIPMTSEQASQPPETAGEYQGHIGDAMERLSESGTIFGTDGKLYEYTYAKGFEPRRIVETRRAQNAFGQWTEEQVERMEWRPVLVRVLRPAGTNAALEERAASNKATANAPKPCAPLSATPEPCEPLGAAERQTYADPDANAASQNVATTDAPPVEGSSTVLAPKREEASVRVATPPANGGSGGVKPILVLPEEARKKANDSNVQSKSARATGSAVGSSSKRLASRKSDA